MNAIWFQESQYKGKDELFFQFSKFSRLFIIIESTHEHYLNQLEKQELHDLNK